MYHPQRIGDLDIHQDILHESREWTIERVAWVVMMLVVLAALAGLLGPGPLASATAGGKGSPLRVEYDRLGRYQAPATLRVDPGPDAAGERRIRIWLSRTYIESIELDHIDPEPQNVEAAPDRFIYTFGRADSGQDAAVVFHFKASIFGRVPVQIGLEGGPQLHFSQFFFP